MNAATPYVLPSCEGELPVARASEGPAHYVWQGRFATIVIEVIDGQIRVNGEPVEMADDHGT